MGLLALLGQVAAPNPTVPTQTNLISFVLTIVWAAVPIGLVLFVVRQVMATRRAAERAAAAAEEMARRRAG